MASWVNVCTNNENDSWLCSLVSFILRWIVANRWLFHSLISWKKSTAPAYRLIKKYDISLLLLGPKSKWFFFVHFVSRALCVRCVCVVSALCARCVRVVCSLRTSVIRCVRCDFVEQKFKLLKTDEIVGELKYCKLCRRNIYRAN